MVKKGYHSSHLHNSRYSTKHPSSLLAKKIILSVIAIATLIVVFAICCTFFLNPENQIKSRITSIATDYYENYFYDNFANSTEFKQISNPDSVLERYRTSGFAPVALRDLLLYDNQKNIEHRDFLTKYCDENSTIVKFYIDPPYDRTSYHYDITYSCNF